MNIRFADDIPSVFPPILLFAGVALTVLSSIQIDESWKKKQTEPLAISSIDTKITKNSLMHKTDIKTKESVPSNIKSKTETVKAPTPTKAVEKKAPVKSAAEDCNQQYTFNFSKNVTLSTIPKKQIDHLTQWMKTHQEATIVVRGHADDSGSEAFNLKLSRRRAIKVANIIKQNGISKNKIKVKAFGEYLPNELMSESSFLQRRVVVETLSSCTKED